MNWIEIVAVSLSGIFVLNILYFMIKYRFQRNNIFIVAQNLYNDLLIMEQQRVELQEIVDKTKLQESDGFVKFLSNSRDWAFQYIEQTQKALVEFDKEVSPVLEWCKTYGLAIEDVHSEQIKKISLAYDKLKEVLPKDNETPNN